jgi:hypothetical protein
MFEVSVAVCLSIASPKYLLMLSIKDLLNPLPIAYHTTKLASPTSTLASRHITPNGSTTNNADHEGGSPTAQSSHRSQSSSPASCSHGTPCRAQLGDPSVSPCRSPSLPPNLCRTIQYNIQLNRKTTLDTLYHYPPGAIVEYPETSSEGCVGHLFEMPPDDWSNPRLNFVYAQGEPSGRTKVGHHILCNLLVNSDGEKVPCREVHSTCMYMYHANAFYIFLILVLGQGCKVCPYMDMSEAQKPHQAVTPEDLKLRVTQQQQPEGNSAQRALFEKTLSLYHVYRVHGCLSPTDMPAISKDDEQDEWPALNQKARRGHNPKLTCNGQLIFDYDHTGKPYVR